MPTLTEFLTSLYDSFSEAEMQALQHGQLRLAELLESETVPRDVSLPVYHATDVEVTLEVGIEMEETEDGMTAYVTESPPERASTFAFTVELFELLDEGDVEKLNVRELLPSEALPSESGGEAGGDEDERAREDTEADEETATNEEEGREDERGRAGSTPIDVVTGIDPEHAARLRERGVGSLSELVERSPEELAELAGGEGSEVSPERTGEWLEQGRGLSTALTDYDDALPVELVSGIGPTFGSRLRENGIGELSQLIERSPAELAEITSTEDVTVSPERTSRWLDEAREQLRTVEELDRSGGSNGTVIDTETTEAADDEQ